MAARSVAPAAPPVNGAGRSARAPRREARRPAGGRPSRPALFARFGDLDRLRHDFPLILGDDGEASVVDTLSGRVDDLLSAIAPAGPPGERLRRRVLRLEREIRAAVSGTPGGSLARLWDAAADQLVAAGDESLAADLALARGAMRLDGTLVDCDATLPARVVRQVWQAVEERHRRVLRDEIDRLQASLADLLRADLLRSAAGRHAAALRDGVGAPHRALFDFEAMARLLAAPSGAAALTGARRARIERALAALADQRFAAGERTYGYVFDDLDAARAAYRERLPRLAELARALAVAELEVEGRYLPDVHDELLGGADAPWPDPEALDLMPAHLVHVDARAMDDAAAAAPLVALADGSMLKVAVTFSDPFSFAGRLAEAAAALGDVFVVQAAISHLHALREEIHAALDYRGPALLSIFAPLDEGAGIPAYLVSAMAVESRAVPAFVYDPTADPEAHLPLRLPANPQPERSWAEHELVGEDDALQQVARVVAVTPADLALCDPRWSVDVAPLPPGARVGAPVPVAAWLAGERDAAGGGWPSVEALDAEGRLHRLRVGERLLRAVRRRAAAWQRLRALSQRPTAERAPSAETAMQPAMDPAAEATLATEQPGAVEVAAAVASDAPDAATLAATSDAPYIETPRCTTCNECVNLNGRMFAYDANRQAYIADPDAGTYRELVEAAESCQVAIIHPGAPRNPDEPGLAELIERAATFR